MIPLLNSLCSFLNYAIRIFLFGLATCHVIQDSKFLLLGLGKDSVQERPHPFLTRYSESRTQLMNKPCIETIDINFDEDKTNFYLSDRSINDPGYLMRDSVFNSYNLLEHLLFYNISHNIILAYPLVEINNDERKFSVSYEQQTENTAICLFVMASIYGWAYQTLLMKYYLVDEKSRDSAILETVLNKVKLAVKTVVISQPIIGKYLGDGKCSKDLFQQILEKAKNLIIRSICDKKHRDKLKEYIYKIVEFKVDTMNIKCITWLRHFKNIQDFIADNPNFNRQPLKRKIDKLLKNNCRLYRKIKQRMPEIESKQIMLEAIYWCINKLYVISKVDLQFPTITKSIGKFDEEEDAIPIMIFDTFNEALADIKTGLKDVIWWAERISNNSIMKMANLIETNLKISKQLVNLVLGQTNEYNICNQVAVNYYCTFPGLIKSICDRRPDLKNKNGGTLQIKNLIDQIITSQDWKIENFMDLYWTVRKVKNNKEKVEECISKLLNKIKQHKINNINDIFKSKNQEVIKVLYTIHILRYSSAIYKPTHHDFMTKFRVVMWFDNMLHNKIADEFKNE